MVIMMFEHFKNSIAKQKTPPMRMRQHEYKTRDEAKLAYLEFEKWAKARNKLLDECKLSEEDARQFINLFNAEYDEWQKMARAWPK